MKLKFKRIISKGNFIPEIDGLRFIAIASVVFYHLYGFFLVKDTNTYNVEYNFEIINRILSVGYFGVPLFFVISGFILARPFAKMYIDGGAQVNIKNYFIRRLTRLEPPYILVMTILLIGAIYVAKTISFQDGIISYLSSITYTHNFFYGKGTLPFLTGVAWSLEIEIQFYILMPLLAKLFLIKKNNTRRTVIITFALLFLIFGFIESMPFISIINYIHYFLIGFLLADIYVCHKNPLKKIKYPNVLAVLFFVIIWLIEVIEPNSGVRMTKIPTATNISLEIIQLISIFIFYYLIVIHRSIKLLANPIITNIGGMCYTIYLIHYPLISMFGNPLVKISFSNNYLINTIIYSSILILIVMIFSAIYFLMIERPCMDKNWYKKLVKNIR